MAGTGCTGTTGNGRWRGASGSSSGGDEGEGGGGGGSGDSGDGGDGGGGEGEGGSRSGSGVTGGGRESGEGGGGGHLLAVGVGGGGGGGCRAARARLPAAGSKAAGWLYTRRRQAAPSCAAGSQEPSLQLRPSRWSHHSMSEASDTRVPFARAHRSHEDSTCLGCRDGAMQATAPYQSSFRLRTYSNAGCRPSCCRRTSPGMRWRHWCHLVTRHMRRTHPSWKVHTRCRISVSNASTSQPNSRMDRMSVS